MSCLSLFSWEFYHEWLLDFSRNFLCIFGNDHVGFVLDYLYLLDYIYCIAFDEKPFVIKFLDNIVIQDIYVKIIKIIYNKIIVNNTFKYTKIILKTRRWAITHYKIKINRPIAIKELPPFSCWAVRSYAPPNAISYC